MFLKSWNLNQRLCATRTAGVPSFTLFLISLQLWGLSGLPVMQAADELLGEAVFCTRAGDSLFNGIFPG